MMRKRGWISLGAAGLLASASAVLGWGSDGRALRAAETEPKAKAETEADPALGRAREQVKMLDEIYKNAVVSITNRYDGPPAIKVAKDLFTAMEKSGWHKAKLVDASGAPQNEANRPQTDFEKRAAEAMQAGKPYYEEVSGEGEDRRLLAA